MTAKKFPITLRINFSSSGMRFSSFGTRFLSPGTRFSSLRTKFLSPGMRFPSLRMKFLSSSIISLSKISKIELLKLIYREIIIPKGVFEEYQKGKNKEFYRDISKFDWIKVTEVEKKKTFEYLLDLDKGEAESIVLAKNIKADLLIIDELRGREFASLKGLKITGTVGFLLKAKEKQLIQTVLPFVYELKGKGIWINDNLIEYVKEIVGKTLNLSMLKYFYDCCPTNKNIFKS
jgi:predicted nucleic acid-binding protein